MSCFWSTGCILPSRMAAAAHPVTPPPPLQPPPASAAETETALVQAETPAPLQRSEIDADSVVGRLPVELEIGVPVHDFRVRNLLALEPGVIVGSHWSHGDDLPLRAGNVQLAWTEFEVVINNLAARITRIA
ncbi:FliM/FliN family flagellar motor C-terminal domain-containing protein [Occallatibacter riparius]|uniref:FliM/FliN family flagellar motor C-terminal domain-containing protein n=1 Tax=Occallatibacter riparius TaxID=1002689 RepID=A0A9J7BPR3_9BACT|nr:FliM/FliN family flagellar motor C-terminal domain-containing protein [Occallatibacter riparius]UWZ82918.1 FliM/FliN family flagellar motor C-terminal domain-containing protein [Occallatibacter riparius]